MFVPLKEPYATIQVSVLLQPHRTVVANFVPGYFGLFRPNPWQLFAEPWGSAEPRLKNTALIACFQEMQRLTWTARQLLPGTLFNSYLGFHSSVSGQIVTGSLSSIWTTSHYYYSKGELDHNNFFTVGFNEVRSKQNFPLHLFRSTANEGRRNPGSIISSYIKSLLAETCRVRHKAE